MTLTIPFRPSAPGPTAPDPTAPGSTAPSPATLARGEVRLDGVTKVFGRGASATTVLADVDLRVAPGEFLAVVGPSGCGKSTVLSLLMRLYDVDGGAIRLDGVDLRDIRLASLRRQFGIVLQESYLFTVDIADNIRRRWGPQIEAGVSTWWEHWDLRIAPGATLCHAFVCAPGYDLPSYILGVTPTEDGFTRFRVAPQPVDLSSLKGVFPSIKGDIPVAFDWDGQTLRISVEVPAGTEAEVVLPVVAAHPSDDVTVDGKRAAGQCHQVKTGPHTLSARYAAV